MPRWPPHLGANKALSQVFDLRNFISLGEHLRLRNHQRKGSPSRRRAATSCMGCMTWTTSTSTKPGAPSSALLCGDLMPMVATVITTRRAPSPEIGPRDTALDGAANGSAGVNSAPNVDAGINSATHLGGRRCGDHEDGGDESTNDRKLAEHI
jgi:hypothetical protein